MHEKTLGHWLESGSEGRVNISGGEMFNLINNLFLLALLEALAVICPQHALAFTTGFIEPDAEVAVDTETTYQPLIFDQIPIDNTPQHSSNRANDSGRK